MRLTLFLLMLYFYYSSIFIQLYFEDPIWKSVRSLPLKIYYTIDFFCCHIRWLTLHITPVLLSFKICKGITIFFVIRHFLVLHKILCYIGSLTFVFRMANSPSWKSDRYLRGNPYFYLFLFILFLFFFYFFLFFSFSDAIGKKVFYERKIS